MGSIANEEFMSSFINAASQNNNPCEDIHEKSIMQEYKLGRETENAFLQFFDLSPDAIYIYCDSKIVYANQAAAKLSTVNTPKDLLGLPTDNDIIPVAHPDSMDIVNTRARLLESREISLPFVEQKAIKNDGTVIYCKVSSTAFMYSGKIHKLVIVRDITELKNVKEELTQRKKLSSSIIEFLPYALYVYRGGRFIFSNKEGLALLGLQRKEDIVGKEVLSFIHPERHNEVKQRIERLDSGDEIAPMMEHKMLRSDGTYIDVETKSIVVPYKDEKIVLVIVQDITKRKQAEKILKESIEYYRRIFEFLPGGIFISDKGQFIFANNNCAEILGIKSPEELIGTNMADFIHKDYISTVNRGIEHLLKRQGTEFTSNLKLVRRDGTIIDTEGTSTIFYNNGKSMVLTIFRDITDKMKLEELKKSAAENKRLLDEAVEYDKIKTEFFANLSHELKTPLNVILGSQQLLNLYMNNKTLMDANQDKIQRNLKVIRQNCNRLLRLLNNIIDITRIDSGFYDVNLQNHNIVHIIEEITLSVAEFIESKGIQLVFDTDTEEKIIACDPDKIERIMLNLISNAIKFTPAGGEINVTIKDEEENISISVMDTGTGIPEDKVGIIFERFRQVDTSFIKEHEGSGIGLSLVKSLVEMHGGSISVESTSGKGSIFKISLPSHIISNKPGKPENFCYSPRERDVERIQVEFADIYSL